MPMEVNGIRFRSVEHLYQALRFPALPDLQRKINAHASPLMAKRCTLSFRDQGRPDWYDVKVPCMDWCLHVKLAWNYSTFGSLLDTSGDKLIVETSPDGNFWGGVSLKKRDGTVPLWGANVLGQLLMQLRDEYRVKPLAELSTVFPLPIDGFLLFGESIKEVKGVEYQLGMFGRVG